MNEHVFDYPSYAWGAVYKSNLFDCVRFPDSYWYEDMMVRFLLYRQANSFVNIDEVLYYRVSHDGQITKKEMTSKDYKVLDHLYLVEQLVSDNNKLGLDNDIYLYMNVLLECSSIMVQRIGKLDGKIKKQVFIRARKLVSGLYKDEYEQYLKGEWKLKSDVILKGRYDLWKMEKWL